MTSKKQIYRTPQATASTAVEIVKIGNLAFLKGQCHNDGLITSPLVNQAEGAYKKIARLLSQLNASMINIVDETVFVTTMDEYTFNYEKFEAIRKSAYGQQPESIFSIVEVKSLMFSGILSGGIKIMIKCTAYLDGSSVASEIPTLIEQQKEKFRQEVISSGCATRETVDSVIYNMPIDKFKRLIANDDVISRIHFRPQ